MINNQDKALYISKTKEDRVNSTLSNLIKGSDQKVIRRALEILEERINTGSFLESLQDTKDYLKMYFADHVAEAFVIVFLDNKHRVIDVETLFTGTIDGSAVYPREIVRAVLKHNASAIIMSHNHPSGSPEPSSPDKAITKRIKEAMDTIDVRTLDHIVVGGAECVSFAERGYL